MAKDSLVWERALTLMQPFVDIRDRGTFFPQRGTLEVPEGLLEKAIEPFLAQTSPRVRRLNGDISQDKVPKNLYDLTDILRDSPLKEDIPPGHLFTGLHYGLSTIFMPEERHNEDPKVRDRKHFGHALKEKVRNSYPFPEHQWFETVKYNYGALWIHLLWHALNARRGKVDALEPLVHFMSLAPVFGFDRSKKEWIVCWPAYA